jgi:hypothetical protein
MVEAPVTVVVSVVHCCRGMVMTSLLRLLAMACLATIADGATLGPRVEILTMLVCDQLKPEYTGGRGMEGLGVHPWGGSEPVASWDPISSHVSWGPAFSYVSGSVGSEVLLRDMHEAVSVVWMPADNGTALPPPSDQCKVDSIVQAAVAKLQGSTWLINPSTLALTNTQQCSLCKAYSL